MLRNIAEQKNQQQRYTREGGYPEPLDSAMLFGVVIKTTFNVTDTINLDHGFCLWIPTFAGMTKRLFICFKEN
jgi:hypothetical protein